MATSGGSSEDVVDVDNFDGGADGFEDGGSDGGSEGGARGGSALPACASLSSSSRRGDANPSSAATLARLSDGSAYDLDAAQMIWSMTKIVTCVCVAMLVDRGLLAYDTTIASVWPGTGSIFEHLTAAAAVVGLKQFKLQGGTFTKGADLAAKITQWRSGWTGISAT